MVKDLPMIDRNSKPIQIPTIQSSFYGGGEFFISGSGSDIFPDTMWYADENVRFVNPTPDLSPVYEIIKIEKSFEKQFSELYHNKDKPNYDRAKAKMQLSLEYIMSLSPFTVSLQLTQESLYYTLIFSGTTLYFEHYYNEISDDMEEALIGIYEKGNNILNYGGGLNKVFTKTLQYFQQKPKEIREVYGVSHRNFTQF